MQELQLHHQRQLEEEARKLKCSQTGSSQQTAVMSNSISGTASNQNQKISSNRGSVTITKSKSNSNNSSVGKGQLISEQIYAVLNFPKMQRNIARISALASKMGQIKKVKAHYRPN